MEYFINLKELLLCNLDMT